MTDRLFDLADRQILITGATGGIGLALAKGLAARGARVVLNGRDAGRLYETAQEIRTGGHQVATIAFDAGDPVSVRDGVNRVERDVGPIDVLINNAGIQHRQPLEDFDEENWDALLRINVSGVFHTSKAVARHMIARRRGKIINIASVQSELARPGIAPYAATKGAVRNLTRGMCTDWARYGLQINAIAPGYFRTPLNAALVADPEFTGWLERRTPAGRWGNVEELLGCAVFLASEASSFVNGQTMFVDGGISVSL